MHVPEVIMLPFHTDRLIVRPPEPSDLPTLVAILGDAEVMKLALYERPFSEREARRFIESDFARDAADVTRLGVVCRRSHAAPMGFAGIFPCLYLPGELEFGFVFAAHAHGQGFATEVGQKFIDVGLRELGRPECMRCATRTMSRHGKCFCESSA